MNLVVKRCRVVAVQKAGRWYWRLVDYFGAVIRFDSAGSPNKSQALEHGREESKKYREEAEKVIELRKKQIVSRFDKCNWPHDWKRLVREFDKLGKVSHNLRIANGAANSIGRDNPHPGPACADSGEPFPKDETE